jgi:hypothetical protein
MRKEAGAAPLGDLGRQEPAHEAAGATIQNVLNSDNTRSDPLAGLQHLTPKSYIPRRRARSAMPLSHNMPDGFEERLPLFLEPDREEVETESMPAPVEDDVWDEHQPSADNGYAAMRLPEPEVLEPPVDFSSRVAFPSLIVRAGVMTVIAAAIAATFVFRDDLVRTVSLLTADTKLPLSSTRANSAEQVATTSFGSRFEGRPPPQSEPPHPPAPKLVANQEPPRGPGETFPLGISIFGASQGTTLVVGGLPAGATLSAGRAAADNTWRLSAAELTNATIEPPRNFRGDMDLTVELRTADDAVSDRRSLRFQWAEPAVADLMASGNVIHHLAPDEIASLLKRADDLSASGDVAAARLVLRRAAEAGDPRAAMGLAGTYDPANLAKLGVHGIVPDVAMAQAWYEKARKFGSAEAGQRIEALAARRP